MLKKLLSDTVWYGVSSIFGRLINYALVPLYTAVLPVSSNGIVTSLYAYAAFLNVLLTFGMETAYFRFARGSESDERQQAARGQTLIATTSVVFLCILGISLPWLTTYLGYENTPLLLAVMAGILISDALTAIPLARLRLQGKAQKFAFYRLGTIGLNVGLNLLFILVFAPATWASGFAASIGASSQPVLWILYANLLSNAPLLFLVERKHFQPKLLEGAQARFMVSYAWPIVVMGLAGMANQMLGILQLERMLPANFYPNSTRLEAVGIYGQCYKLSIFMALVVQAFRLGAEPFFFSMAGKDNKEAGFALVMKWFVVVCIGILVGVTVNLPWLAPLILRNPAYQEGLSIVPTLLMANLWLGVYYNLSVWFKLTDRTAWGTWLSLGGMVLTVVLNTWLIPTLGYDGAAIATAVCYFCMAMASYLIGQKYMPVPYPAWQLLLYVALWFIACEAFRRITPNLSNNQIWVVGGGLAVLYALWILIEALPLLKGRFKRVS